MPPGQEGQITLAVEHTEGYSGEVVKAATVATNDPAYQTFSLMLRARFKLEAKPGDPSQPKGYPLPGAVVGPFVVEPVNRWVTSVITGTSAQGTLYLYNPAPTPVHVKKVIPGGSDFDVSVQPIEAGKRYEMKLSTKPNLKPGQYHQTVLVQTDSKAMEEVPIQLDATVFPRVFATPNTLALPGLSLAGDLGSLNLPLIYVRKIRDAGLFVKKISSTLAFIKLELATETEGSLYTLRVSIDKSKIDGPGEFKGQIAIETNDPDTPVLEVAVHGSFK